MANKHTPGPWHQNKYLSVVDAKGKVISFRGVTVLCAGQGVEEAEFNTKLAAAAPELLEALRWYIENDDTNIGMEGNEFWEEGLERGKAAVKKATGE